MLDTIRRCIAAQPDIDFNQFFVEYILSVQDGDIYNEIEHVMNQAKLDLTHVNRYINKLQKEFNNAYI